GGPLKPAGGFDIPPPSMDLGTKPPGALPPPSLNVEGGDSKFPAAPPLPVMPEPSFPPPGPPATGGPAVPVIPPAPPAPKPFPAPPAPYVPDRGTPPAPPAPFVPERSTPAVTGAGLPATVKQSVTVEAVCPESVVFGAECRYELVVRNTGNVPVQNVRIEDEIPAGARYVGSDPPGEHAGDKLVWALGTMDGNTEKRIAVRVRPTEEGELRSRAAVVYTATVEVRTKVTRPRVAVTVVGPEVGRTGDDAIFRIRVTNSGTGPAQNMVLQALMSEGLYHQHGAKLETKLANLAAGESKNVDLTLSAMKSGLQWCQITVTAEGSQDATAKASVNVVEPVLQVAQTGPAKCLVRGEPTYEITLSNPGTAATDSITVHAVLPDGFDYVQASDAGGFSATHRAVSWKLPGLPPGGTKSVAVKLRAAAAGDVVLRTVAHTVPEQAIAPAGVGAVAKPAGRVLEAKAETAIKAEGVAAVRFDVKGLENPVEVGKDAVYEIRVTNQGTGACTNVQLMAALADATTFTGATGPTKVTAQGQTLVFEAIPNLPVKGEMVYTVRVRGNAAGDQRIRVQLTCDQVRTPVVKEESTSFYKQ
ncbi:MAG: DUF11 domain-containing protein, partial [Planctomycetes bacterium]|nr:DUF11 domain-containing protein [Planctomycetota bacterium]